MKSLSLSDIILSGILCFEITSLVKIFARYDASYYLGNGVKTVYFVSLSITTIMFSHSLSLMFVNLGRGPIKSIDIIYYARSGAWLDYNSL